MTTLKLWFKYYLIIAFFGIAINLLYLALPVYILVIYDRVMSSFSIETLQVLTLGMALSMLTMGILTYFRAKVMRQAAMDLEKKMIRPLLGSMMERAASLSGEAYSQGLRDLRRVRESMTVGGFFRLLDLPWIILYLAVLFFMHPLLAAFAAAGLGIISIFHFFLHLIVKRRYAFSDILEASASRTLHEGVEQAETLAGMGMTAAFVDRVEAHHWEALAGDHSASGYLAGTGAVIHTLIPLTVTAVFGSAAYLHFINEMTPGVMMASIPVTLRLFFSFEQRLILIKSTVEGFAAFRRLRHHVRLKKKADTFSLPRPRGRLTLENVTLVSEGRPLLQNISLEVAPGETLGIVGPSGSGKSLILQVMLGSVSPTTGKVMIDGADIAQWPRDLLGSYMGYHPQGAPLFSGRVDENIARFQSVDADGVVMAAQKAGAHAMVQLLPDGYNTVLTQGGRNLSGGERKGISMARALYGEPPIVIMDEPHAGIDDMGLKALYRTAAGLKQEKKTLILVTDRITLLRNADKILVMQDRQVASFGSAAEIMTQFNIK